MFPIGVGRSQLLDSAFSWPYDYGDLLNSSLENNQDTWNKLPEFVQVNYQTVSFPLLCAELTDNYGVDQTSVAFEVGTNAWRLDVHESTLSTHDRIRIYDVLLNEGEGFYQRS